MQGEEFLNYLEDMAYKNYSVISPKMVKKFLVPVYERWVLEIKESSSPPTGIDSDGYIEESFELVLIKFKN